MMKRNSINLAAIITAFSLLFAGCGGNAPAQSQSYDDTVIEEIHITTGGADVMIEQSSGEGVYYSIDGAKDSPAELDGSKLTLTVPMPDAGINLSEPKPLIVRIPEDGCAVVTVESETGNVSVKDVKIDVLRITTLYGDITLSGMEGHFAAKAEMGSIKTDLPVAGEIKGLDIVGQELDEEIGATESEINLYTNTGTIELK